MKPDKFNELLTEILERTTKVLSTKSDEYSTESDKLWNFKRAGKMLNCTPEKALVGMWTKHIISILDIVDKLDSDGGFMDMNDHYDEHLAMIEEKITDAINYLILLEALIRE